MGGDGDENGKGKHRQEHVKINIVENLQEKNLKDEMPKDGKILVKQIKKKIKKKIEEPKCDDYYYGIGIVQDNLSDSCAVSKVAVGYPAWKNGIQVGDIITSPPCWDIRGPDGSTINMTIIRDGKIIHLSFKRGKICGTK